MPRVVADGVDGFLDARLVVFVPCAVQATASAAAVVQYAHGLFNTRAEVRTRWLTELAGRCVREYYPIV